MTKLCIKVNRNIVSKVIRFLLVRNRFLLVRKRFLLVSVG